MDNRPIGFFDSGLGGLTCVPHVMESLPNERIIYFGDTARTPYGSKSTSTIRTFSFEIADFLIKKNVKMIVIACNTVSSTVLYDLREKYPHIPVLGIISPTCYTIANKYSPQNEIGIIGTKVTVQSKAYEKKIKSLRPDIANIHEKACPAFVPLIEEGIIDHEIMNLTIKYYLDDFIYNNKIDTLILGCTHYPMIRDNISRIYPNLSIIDPSQEILQSITDTLQKYNIFAGPSVAHHSFYASDLSENFTNMSNKIFKPTNCPVLLKETQLDFI